MDLFQDTLYREEGGRELRERVRLQRKIGEKGWRERLDRKVGEKDWRKRLDRKVG